MLGFSMKGYLHDQIIYHAMTIGISSYIESNQYMITKVHGMSNTISFKIFIWMELNFHKNIIY
jgi:hypothetical protein